MHFVNPNSILKQIWSETDMILLIFVGASAEFALNPEVDWLFFTGKIPKDPVGRMVSTVKYAQQIINAERDEAFKIVTKINKIHQKVELNRNMKISNAGNQDVLAMLIDYSIRSFEMMERKLNSTEKEEIYQVFKEMGIWLSIHDLAQNYGEWEIYRKNALAKRLVSSRFTTELFKSYKRNLKAYQYYYLLGLQNRVCASVITNKLTDKPNAIEQTITNLFFSMYLTIRKTKVATYLLNLFLPTKFTKEFGTEKISKCPFH